MSRDEEGGPLSKYAADGSLLGRLFCSEPLYARTLKADGALTWDLPPAITQHRLPDSQEPFTVFSQYFQECLTEESSRHFHCLSRQLLEGMGVQNVEVWVEVVVRISEQLTSMLSIRKAHERRIPISRDGLKIELLPDIGTPADSCVIPGVVLRKDIAHRRMREHVYLPRLLLISGALELECNRLTQLHTVINREPEFIDAAVDRILAVAPDVCVVERNASRYAIKRLREANVTLIHNIPMADMANLAINTSTRIVENILDVDESCVGTCVQFYVLRVKQPSSSRATPSRFPSPLMVFEVSSDQAASAVVLRGGCEADLALVQNALSFAVFAAYRLHFENAFLRDTLANAAVTTALYGVEGLPGLDDKECMHQVCKQIVERSTQRASVKRLMTNTVVSVSPHISSWTAGRSQEAFRQIKDYRKPVCDSARMTRDNDNESETTSVSTTASVLNTESASAEGSSDVIGEDKDCVRDQTESKDNGFDVQAVSGNAACQLSRDNDESSSGEGSGDVRSEHVSEDAFFRRMFSDGSARRLAHWGSNISLESHNGSDQAALPNAWNDWSDVEMLRGSGDLATIPQPLYEGEDELAPQERSSKKLRVMETLRFSASFANRNHRLGLLCEPCHVLSINSYSNGDLSLMEFLMSIAADAPKRCPAGCGGGNSSHSRTFLHGAVRLTISVVSLPPERSYPNPETDVWFWARPKGVSAEPMPTISQILLSEDSKCLSLGQFLQLMCSTHDLKVFGRQLYIEHVIYFGYGRTVACIYGDRIRLKTVRTPAPRLHYSLHSQVNWFNTSVDQLVQEVNFVYDAVLRSCFPSLTPTAADGLSEKIAQQMSAQQDIRSALVSEVVSEKEHLCEEIREIAEGIDLEDTTNDKIQEKYLRLNRMWRRLGINLVCWSETVNDPDHPPNSNTEAGYNDISLGIGTRISDALVVNGSGGEFLSSKSFRQLSHRSSEGIELKALYKEKSQKENEVENGHGEGKSVSDSANSELLGTGCVTDPDKETLQLAARFSTQADLADESLHVGGPLMPMDTQQFPPSPFVHSGQQPDWEREDPFNTTDTAGLQLRIPPTQCTLESIESPSETPAMSDTEVHSRLKPTSSVGELFELSDRDRSVFSEGFSDNPFKRQLSVSLPASPREYSLLNQLDRRLNHIMDDEEYGTDSEVGEIFQTQQTQMLPARRSSHLHALTPTCRTPLPGTEIRLSCRALFPLGNDDLVIPVFEAEPASIIAHVLSSISYHKDLQQSFESLAYHASLNKARPADSSGDLDYAASDSGSSRVSLLTDLRSSRGKSSQQMHVVQRFEDSAPGMVSSHAKFEVVSYFAPLFTKMRARCINGGERSFVMSMSRSRRWKASGGKSNAYFAKTLDDRYIIKSLSKAEKASFLDKLGPCYFNHMETQYERRKDVALAKILGLFQVSMKSSSRSARTEKVETGSDSRDLGREWVMDLIIVENVFYDRQCSSIYDLKGSHRGRYNKEAEKSGDQCGVYLDANLRKHYLVAPPLLIDQSSFNRLAETLRRDTDFLVNNSIMDYSLLVGVDSESNCLVVGIIDYIRQYTWDKRLESWVKSSGIMGDGTEEPTIISPDSYRKRFMATILGYFTVVPYL